MTQQLRASAYHLKPPDIRKLIIAAPNFGIVQVLS